MRRLPLFDETIRWTTNNVPDNWYGKGCFIWLALKPDAPEGSKDFFSYRTIVVSSSNFPLLPSSLLHSSATQDHPSPGRPILQSPFPIYPTQTISTHICWKENILSLMMMMTD